MNQISLNIPFQLNLKLEKPLYFRYKKVKCGIISQVAIKEGLHSLTAVHKYNLLYEVSTDQGQSFQVSLEGKKDGYNITGPAEHIPEKYVLNDTRIDSNNILGKSLRKAQIGATYSLLAHWSLSNEVATIVLPTGTGKTETMLVSALADKASKILVIVPTVDLKTQIADKFSTWGILRELGVITGTTSNPSVLVLNKTVMDIEAIGDINSVDVVVSTPALIARANKNVLEEFKKSFSHVFFDEAHHIEASEWKQIKVLFKDSKIVQFTATPYRNDRRPIEGKVVYNYSLARALKDKCFSKISLISVDERHPKKKDKAIAEAAVAKLIQDREKEAPKAL